MVWRILIVSIQSAHPQLSIQYQFLLLLKPLVETVAKYEMATLIWKNMLGVQRVTLAQSLMKWWILKANNNWPFHPCTLGVRWMHQMTPQYRLICWVCSHWIIILCHWVRYKSWKELRTTSIIICLSCRLVLSVGLVYLSSFHLFSSTFSIMLI